MPDPAEGTSAPSSRIPWHEVRVIGVLALFGAGGGLLSWIYSISIGEPLQLGAAGAFAASLALGSFAGTIGVLVLANLDTTAAFKRTVAIALLFGFFWKPTVEAAGALINKKTQERAEKQARALTAEADRALASLAVAPKADLEAKVFSAAAKWQAATQATARVEKRSTYITLTIELDGKVASLEKTKMEAFRNALNTQELLFPGRKMERGEALKVPPEK